MGNVNGSGEDAPDSDAAEPAELDALRQEYLGLLHAMQTGVAMMLQQDPTSGSPKHLRVGVNSAKAEQGGLVRLLVSKGVISELEYYRAMVEAARAEVAAYERDLLRRHGIVVKLG